MIDQAILDSLRHKRECSRERRRLVMARDAQLVQAAHTFVCTMQTRFGLTDDGMRDCMSSEERAAYKAALYYLARAWGACEPGGR